MSPSLTDLPLDVLLKFAKRLDVKDLLNFLSICQVLRELQSQKTIWLDALVLIKEVHNQPLPLSKRELGALNTASLRQLQDTVRRANRLMNNFESDSPRSGNMRIYFFDSTAP
ncbi:hypothetical protein B0H19DRAFT_1252432 [Mycena capillaripes]|nr:hypothetical protein B0H19DRAFT_1252432 [Mycena capillaripes]